MAWVNKIHGIYRVEIKHETNDTIRMFKNFYTLNGLQDEFIKLGVKITIGALRTAIATNTAIAVPGQLKYATRFERFIDAQHI